MADAPERIWIGEDVKFFPNDEGAHITHDPEATHIEYVRADITPPAAVVEALERALRHADQVSRDLGWHRIYDETGAALAVLKAWRAGK